MSMIWLIAAFWPIVPACILLMVKPRPGLSALLLGSAVIPALAVGLVGSNIGAGVFPDLFLISVFELDLVRSVFLVFTALLWGVAGWYAGYYEANDTDRARMSTFLMVALAGNLGLIMAADILTFYGFFVLMTFASYGLVVHVWTPEAFRAGHIYLILAIIGEVLLLVAIFLAVDAVGTTRLDAFSEGVAGAKNLNWIVGLALLGFGVKAGAIPLYFWLPLAHPVAPTPASAVLSGAMIKAGLIGWMHLVPVGAVDLPGWGGWVIAAGMLATFGGVAIGLVQSNLKTILAYSSISQMGLMTVLFGIGMTTQDGWGVVAPALALYALNHGLSKGALFLGVGVVTGTPRSRAWILAGMVLAALVLAGAPLTGGGMVKYALKDAAGLVPEFWTGALGVSISLATVGTTLLMGRFLWLWREKQVEGESHPVSGLALPWGVLIILVPWFAFLIGWHFSITLPAPANLFSGIMEGAWPILLGIVFIFLILRGWLPAIPYPKIPPGDLVVVFERLYHRLRSQWAKRIGRSWEREVLNIADLADRIIAFEHTKSWVNRVELRLGSWNLVGLLIIALILGLIFLLLR